MRLILLVVSLVLCARGYSAQDGFIYPEDFEGGRTRAAYDTSVYGYATNSGYVSVFNLERKVIESFLPPQFGLGELKGKGSLYPLIVVWGRMTDTGGFNVFKLPFGPDYNEMHFFIPGVYRKNMSKHALRTYTPRMFVDAFAPEFWGRRYYYKKILLDAIGYNINSGMETGDWVTAKVLSVGQSAPAVDYDDHRWSSVLAYLPFMDIMADHEGVLTPRCSGFEWIFNRWSRISPAEVSLKIHRPLTSGMDPSIVEKPLRSVASFRVENWQFIVDYDYTDCK